jgi:hypothetical protein
MKDELRDLRDWLPYSPEAHVQITVVHDTITGSYLHRSMVTGTARFDVRRALAREEGIRWIRGHHDEQSAEGQALLAAHALARDVAA